MRDDIFEKLLLGTALSAVAMLGLITFFIFKEGVPFIITNSVSFLFGTNWYPSEKLFGILPFILGSIWVTLGALVLGVPVSLCCSIYLVEYAGSKVRKILKPGIELLAAVPSVVYGFIGVVVLAPIIRNYFGGPGFSILAASIILAIMILPTIIGISMDALSNIPKEYVNGSVALGAGKWQTITMVMIPAARSGIVAAIILGMGRAIGETMAVIMIAGNSIQLPVNILEPVRTLTSNIALEMGYAQGAHRSALFATGVVLFAFIMVLNTAAIKLSKNE